MVARDPQPCPTDVGQAEHHGRGNCQPIGVGAHGMNRDAQTATPPTQTTKTGMMTRYNQSNSVMAKPSENGLCAKVQQSSRSCPDNAAEQQFQRLQPRRPVE